MCMIRINVIDMESIGLETNPFSKWNLQFVHKFSLSGNENGMSVMCTCCL